MSYSRSTTTRSYQYSSSGGHPGQQQTTETRTYIDSDGTRRTETTTYSGSNSNQDNFSHSHFRNEVDDTRKKLMDAGINPSRAPTTEKRYNQGWGAKNRTSRAALPVRPGGKTYEEIKDMCLQQGRLFEDPDFPAIDSSIFYSRTPPRPFEWKRPPEITRHPKLFVAGASRFDVKQGELGDCWLLAAVASLTIRPKLLFQVVPQDQGFSKNEYCGAFHFRFWRYGEWQDVIIDDRLPTYNGKLVFLHSSEHNEFWTALIEKAYAKTMGSYESLKGGATSEGMEDFTGGVTEMFDFRQNLPEKMFTIMLQAHKRSSLMGCSIDALPGQMEAALPNGLIMGHAYSITDVRLVNIQTSRMQGKIPLVRVRNPWGNECEWKGAWSDKSKEWGYIPEKERQEMGLKFDHDGEFWMSFKDFSSTFQKVEICHLGVEGFETRQRGVWHNQVLDGSWRKRVNAGGCRNFLDTFWTNPQYRVQVIDPDEDDDDDTGTIIVGLMQKHRRKLKKEGLDMLTQGYVIYKLKNPKDTSPLNMNFFKYNASVAKSPAFINLREICGRHKLAPGTYVIIPSTFEPQQEGDFLIRIFSEAPADTQEMDEETGMEEYEPREVTEQDKQQEDSIRKAFQRVAGEDMEVDAFELMDILNAAFLKASYDHFLGALTQSGTSQFTFEGFSLETCRSMVAMTDADHSGKLGFEEFKKLWNGLRHWKKVFKEYDKDASGNLNSYELRQAFHGVGFKISNATFNGLVQRYSRKDGKIHFDDFVHCTVRMKTMFETYEEMKGRSGKAEFTKDQFIQTTMYS